MTSRRIHPEMASWYIRRAYHNFRQAQKYFILFNNVESIISSYESIEFSIKAMCKLLDIKFGKDHFVKARVLSILGEKIEREHLGNKDEILRVIPIMLGYTDELRNIARYGIESNGVPTVSPTSIFHREYAISVLKDAKNLHNLLGSIEIKRRWTPKVKMAILNGLVGEQNEIECPNYPFTNNNPNYWKNKFKNLNKTIDFFDIEKISAADINEEFAIVLNPFGEEYPEINVKDKSIFYLIKDYVAEGGVYINTAGYPFFYAWDVKEGQEYPLSEEKIFIPKVINIADGQISIGQMQQYLQFTGTLLFKEYDAIPTPVSKTRNLYQDDIDLTNFGDIINGIDEINEFRALPKGTKDCVPIVRAKDEISEEVYPISALKRDKGYLLLASMNTEQEKEADLFVKAVHSFCNWIINNLAS